MISNTETEVTSVPFTRVAADFDDVGSVLQLLARVPDGLCPLSRALSDVRDFDRSLGRIGHDRYIFR